MKNLPFLIGFVVIGVIVAISYSQFYHPEPPVPAAPLAPAEKSEEKPEILYPVTVESQEIKDAEPFIALNQPLPVLKKSDESMSAILAKFFHGHNLENFFALDHIIERFVVMVDNLPREQLPTAQRSLKTTPGEFLVKGTIPGNFLAMGESDQLSIAPANYQRYAPLVRMLNALNEQQVVAVYKRLYPLFQEAYEGLGYPEAYFNDRLIAVIDHLLATPQITSQVFLYQPKVLYLYADPELEALSSGRKILLRIGAENATQIKTMLRKYLLELSTDI